MIDKALKWPLFSGSVLDRWTCGKLVVLGDAAHAMLPYMSQGTSSLSSKLLHIPTLNFQIISRAYLVQSYLLSDNAGAAIAVEDSLALARSLAKIESKTQIPKALSLFEKVRIQRASGMQEASLLNGKLWHFPDGPLQRARDAAMLPEVNDLPFSHSPNQWSDPATQMWCFGYDAEGEIEREWMRYRVAE